MSTLDSCIFKVPLFSEKHFDPLLTILYTVAPKIDRKDLQKKKIKVGQPLKMEADVKGEPEPTITWTFNGQPLKPEERLKIENKV